MCHRFLLMTTSRTSHPTYCFKNFPSDTPEVQETFQVTLAWMAQVTMDPPQSLFDGFTEFSALGNFKSNAIRLQALTR